MLSTLAFIAWFILGFILVLVVIGLFAQLFSRKRTVPNVPFHEQEWGEEAKESLALASSTSRRPGAPRRASSSRDAGFPTQSSPRSRGQAELVRQVSAPIGRLSANPERPPAVSALMPERSSSSSSSVLEKAKKNWLMTLDERPREPLQSDDPASQSDVASSSAHSGPGAPAPESLHLVPGQAKLAARPPSDAAAAARPRPTQFRGNKLAIAANLVVLSSLGLFAYGTQACFDLTVQMPVDRVSCPIRPMPPQLHSLMYASALGFSKTRMQILATANLSALASLSGLSGLAKSAAMQEGSASAATAWDAKLLRRVLVVACLLGVLAVVVGCAVRAKAPRSRPALAPLAVDLTAETLQSATSLGSNAVSPDLVSIVTYELEARGLEVFRADPKGVQLPENVNLDAIEKSLVFVLVVSRDAYCRESCLMEVRCAAERNMPLVVLQEPGAEASAGPPEFARLVQQLETSSTHFLWDGDESREQCLREIERLVKASTSDRSFGWQVFVSHWTRPRVDSTLFRPLSPIPSSRGSPLVMAPITTVRDSLAVLVAHVADRESVSALSRLIEVQASRGYLLGQEAGTLMAVLRAKGALEVGKERGFGAGRHFKTSSSDSVLLDTEPVTPGSSA